MGPKSRIAALSVAALVAVIGAALVTAQVTVLIAKAGADDAGPRPTGAVQNFTLHAASKPVSELRFTDRDGQPLGLGEFGGKVVLLNIWATWCAPCRYEMPSLDRLQAALGGQDFQVVVLAVDRGGMPKVLDFFTEVGLKHLTPYVDQTTKASRALRVYGLPTTLLLDRQGREIGRLIGPAEWDTAEAKALIRHYIGAKGPVLKETEAPSGGPGTKG